MPNANILKADDPDRSVGVVYRDSALADVPATHVLVVGVAAYRSKEYSRVLDTAARSARAVADWFLGSSKARFQNPRCGLGSLAVLLSEAPGAARAEYAGGEIPRATFGEVKEAVRAWVRRINTHKDNLAILYIASHGESFLNRTAFLLEDYGTDPEDVTAGMSEVEQFVSALENAVPVAQLLLFDCCRNPTSVHLPPNELIGNKLIALTRKPDDHGIPRKQWVICSTSLGEYAEGLAKGPTLFNMALLDALNGVASDVSEEGWPVRPGLLVDKIDRVLALYRLPDERAQTPAGRMAGSFDINFPGEPEAVPVYITLKDPSEWDGTTLSVSVDGGSPDTVQGAPGTSPFHLRRVPQQAVIEVTAERESVSIGSAKAKVRAPAVFLEVRRDAAFPGGGADVASYTTSIGSGPRLRTHSLEPTTRLVLAVQSPVHIARSAVVEIVQQDTPSVKARQIIIDIGADTPLNLEPGEYAVTLRTPDGRAETREVTLPESQIVALRFSTQESPHEWMIPAVITGAVRPLSQADMRFTTSSGNAPGMHVEIAGAIEPDLQRKTLHEAQPKIAPGPFDERFSRMEIQDEVFTRFPGDTVRAPPPVFARILLPGGREEFAILPSVGFSATQRRGGWSPFLLVDRLAPLERSATAVVVDSTQWIALLGYLGVRDFAQGCKILEAGLGQVAMREGKSNPLADIAVALVAVASASPDFRKMLDSWMADIAHRFQNIPDGPIVLARQVLMRARTEKELDLARRLLMEGLRRGIPYYSLSIDWLARGLESLPGDDDALIHARAVARRLANRVDPAQAFTVIRVSN